MKYYLINHSVDKKILGHYPQTKSIEHNCDIWEEPRFIEHLDFVKADFEAITSNAILHPKSRLTDLINVSGMGFTRKLLISGRFRKILENFKIQGVQFFQSNVILNRKVIEDFWVLNSYQTNMDSIDYADSNVYLTKNTVNIVKKLEIKTFEEFLSIKKEIEKNGYPEGIRIEDFRIKEDSTLDFLTIVDVLGGVKYIVSEILKKKIETENCIGIEFLPIDIPRQEWTAPGGARESIYGKV